MQYTIRDIPPKLDEALRTKAEREGKSLNQTVVDALSSAVGVPREAEKHWLDDWLKDGQPLAPEVVEAIEEQGRMTPIEKAEWKRAISKTRRNAKAKSNRAASMK